MAKLVPTDFQITEDGQYYIHDKWNKTGVFYTADILEQGVEILKSITSNALSLGIINSMSIWKQPGTYVALINLSIPTLQGTPMLPGA